MEVPGQPGDPPGMELEDTEEPSVPGLTQRRTTGNPSGRVISFRQGGRPSDGGVMAIKITKTGSTRQPEQVLSELVRDGTLSEEQLARVLQALERADIRAPDTAVPKRSTGAVAEILSYLGAAVTVGALTLVVGLSWNDLGQTGQILICAAITALFGVLSVIISSWRGSVFAHRRRAVAAVLAALAAVAAALGTAQVADSAGLTDGWTAVVIGMVLAAFGTAAYVAWRRPPSVLVIFAAGIALVIGLLIFTVHGGGREADTLRGIALFLYGAGWAAVGLRLREPHLPSMLGGLTALFAAEFLAVVNPWPGLVLGMVAVAGLFVRFWTGRNWWYGAAGVLGALAVPATAVGRLWSGLFAAVVLLSVGILLVAGALVLAGRRKSGRPSLPQKTGV